MCTMSLDLGTGYSAVQKKGRIPALMEAMKKEGLFGGVGGGGVVPGRGNRIYKDSEYMGCVRTGSLVALSWQRGEG